MEEKKKKTNKKLTIIIVTLILAALCTFGYFACRKIKENDAKQKFFNAIDKLFVSVAKEKQEEIKTYSGDYTITMDVTSRFIDQEIQDIINKLKLNFKLDVDNEKNNYNFNLNTSYDGDKLLNAKLSAQDNTLYLFLDNLYSKWIKVDGTVNVNTDNLLTTEDYKVLASEIEKAINHALKNSYFKKDKENDLNKYTLTIDKNNASSIVENVLDYLENSKDFIKVYEKASNVKFSEAAKQAKAETKLYATMNPILISIYTDNNDDIKQLALETTENEEVVKVVFEIIDVNNIKITIYDDDVAMISGSIENIDEKDKTTVNIKLSMMGMFTAKVKIVSSVKYNEKITLPTITNSVEASDLTETDIQGIYTKLLSNQGLIKILEAINNYMNQKEEI